MKQSYTHNLFLSASLLINQVTSAPIRLTTRQDDETNIWVTSYNTLNATAQLDARSLQPRQWSGGFGRSWGSSFPLPIDNPFGPPQGPNEGTIGAPNTPPFGPPNDNPFTTGNTLLPATSSVYEAPPPSTSTAPTSLSIASTTSVSTVPSSSLSSVELSTSASAASSNVMSSASVASMSSTSFPASSTTSMTPISSTPASSPASSSAAVSSTAPSSASSAPSTASSFSSTTSSVPPPPPSPTSSTAPSTMSTVVQSSASSSTSSATSAVPTSSAPPPVTSSAPPAPSGSSPPASGNTLQLSLVNNLGSSSVNAYVTGLDSNGQVVMLTTSGSYYYLTSPGSTTPQQITADVALPLAGPGQTTTLTLPDYLLSARVWFADGTLSFYAVDTQYGPGLVEPTTLNPSDAAANTNWGFMELTFKAGYGLFANLSFVDFVGLPLGMQLQGTSSGTQSIPGMPADAVSQVCNLLQGQATADGQPWDQLCMNDANGNLLRVTAPPTLISQDANAFSGYWDDYVNEIWQQYTSEQLMVDTQGSPGQVACTTDGNTMTCDGDNAGYSKPNSEDIFGCNSGPFALSQSDNDVHLAVVPRICAAFNRATLHLEGGNVQPSLSPSNYYNSSPNNWYSAIVHQVEAEGKGYAFSYDDVSPSEAENTSGSVYAADPTVLTIYVGGVSSSS